MISNKEIGLFIARAGLTSTILASSLLGAACKASTQREPIGVVNPTAASTPESQLVPDLGLKIDEAGFWRAVYSGPRFGTITESWDRNRIDCLRPLEDFCIAEESPSFAVGLNRPMVDFMFRQADLTNPSLPTRMVIVEDWLGYVGIEGAHVGGYSAISDNGSEQVIVVSLKSAVLEAFKDLEKKGLPPEDYFKGAVSYWISWITAHEIAHGGAQTKKLLKPGQTSIAGYLQESTHPQIHAFNERYAQLYAQAQERGLGEGALILAVDLDNSIDLQAYKAKILQEAKERALKSP